MLKYSHPVLALILEYWPITIFAPTILLLIATLALITRWWDRRDQEARENLMLAGSGHRRGRELALRPPQRPDEGRCTSGRPPVPR